MEKGGIEYGCRKVPRIVSAAASSRPRLVVLHYAHHQLIILQSNSVTVRRGRKSPPLRLTRFPTAWRDPNGLIYLRSRFYHPDLGMFLSRDPVEGVLNRPMSLNGYSYAEGNPVNLTDPSGMIFGIDDAIIIAGLIIGGIGAAIGAGSTIVRGDHDLGDILASGIIGFGAGFVGSVTFGIISTAVGGVLLPLAGGATATSGAASWGVTLASGMVGGAASGAVSGFLSGATASAYESLRYGADVSNIIPNALRGCPKRLNIGQDGVT